MTNTKKLASVASLAPVAWSRRLRHPKEIAPKTAPERVQSWVLATLLIEGVALLALLLAERREHEPAQFVAKGVASAAFVALGLLAQAPAAILVALALAFVGDLLLVPRDPRVFRVGIVVFLLAHVAFLVAFSLRSPAYAFAAGALLILALAAALVARWILPRVPRALKGAVLAYMLVITLMVAAAAGASAGAGPIWLVLPALAFWTNDILVARDRFVARQGWHRWVGLPLYYGAMTAFALAGTPIGS